MSKYPEAYTLIEKLPQKLVSIKGSKPMFWPFSIYKLLHSEEKYIWAAVRILHETDKAILGDNGMKTWIPKSRIRRIRLRNNIFEIYVKESTVG